MAKIRDEHGRLISNHYDKDGKYLHHGEVNNGEKMTVENESYTIRELLEKFTTGVMQPQQMLRAGSGYEFEDGIFDSEEPEPYIDRTDIEEHAAIISSKIAASKKAKKNETTKKLADEEVKEVKPEKDEAKSTN